MRIPSVAPFSAYRWGHQEARIFQPGDWPGSRLRSQLVQSWRSSISPRLYRDCPPVVTFQRIEKAMPW